MTKSLMLSINPKHLLNILNGYKTLELRKTVPKDFKGWVYIYCTNAIKDILYKYKDKHYTQHYLTFTDCVEVLNSKVVARFWFDEYDKYVDVSNCGMTSCGLECDYDFKYWLYDLDDELKKLCLTYDEVENYGKGKDLYTWHIKQLEIFDEPKELSEFYSKDISECINDMKVCQQVYGLKKAPQSYQFVYTKEE